MYPFRVVCLIFLEMIVLLWTSDHVTGNYEVVCLEIPFVCASCLNTHGSAPFEVMIFSGIVCICLLTATGCMHSACKIAAIIVEIKAELGMKH